MTGPVHPAFAGAGWAGLSPPNSASRDTVCGPQISTRWSIYTTGIGRCYRWGDKRVSVTCVCSVSRPRHSPVTKAPSPLGRCGADSGGVQAQRGQEPLESHASTVGDYDLNPGACNSAPPSLTLTAPVRVQVCLPSALVPEPFPNTTNRSYVASPPLLDDFLPLRGPALGRAERRKLSGSP